TSIDGAHGILMNINGGTNLSLYEVQEAADLVTNAADEEVNVIFGSVINEDLKDEIIVTVIATGFDENKKPEQPVRQRPAINQNQTAATRANDDNVHTKEPMQQQARPRQEEDILDIPTFLRNRNRNR